MAECGINYNLAKRIQLNNIRQISGSFLTVGELDCEMSMDDFAQFVSDTLHVSDMKYHQMLNWAEQGCAVISAGHYETEHDSFIMLMDKLKDIFTDVEFMSAQQKNPVLAV